MAKLLDSTKITSNLQKVVETPKGLIVNGAYYDKNSLVVKPFKMFPGFGDPKDLAMNKRMILRGAFMYNCLKTEDTIIVDRFDPTIYYVFTTSIRDNTLTMMKFKQTDTSFEMLANFNFGANPSTSPLVRCVLGQDQYYIYIATEANTTSGSYFTRIDKLTFAMVNTTLATYTGGVTLLKETDTHIFYACKKSLGQTNAVYRYNKVTALTEAVPVAAKTGTVYFGATYSKPWVIADNEAYIYSVYHTASPAKMNIVRYKFDATKINLVDYIVESDPVITWDGVTSQLPVPTSSMSMRYDTFITTATNGKKYLTVMIYENAGTSSAASLAIHGAYTFLIDPTTKDLTFKGFVSFSNVYLRGFQGIRENTFLVLATDDTTIFSSFDETIEKFVVTDTISNQPMHIGIDLDENIWIVNGLTEVDMYAPFVPTSVKLTFEKSVYKYEGSDINSYVTIEAKNYAGANIAVNLELTISSGDAVFTSNSSKVLLETTGTTGPKMIPITVKSAANLTVTPKLIL